MEYPSDAQVRLFVNELLGNNNADLVADFHGIQYLILSLLSASSKEPFKFSTAMNKLETLESQLVKDFSSARESGREEEYDRMWMAWIILSTFRQGITFDQRRIRS